MKQHTDMVSQPARESSLRAAEDRALRVLMVDSATTWRGGQNQLALLIRGLREHDVDLCVAAPPDAALLDSDAARDVSTFRLKTRHGMDLLAAARLARHLSQERYDIVHCHTSHAHSTAFFATWPARWRRAAAPSPSGPRLVVSRRVAFPVARHGPAAMKYRSADLFLAISSGIRDVLVQSGVASSQVALVPSGVDLEMLRAPRAPQRVRTELGIARDATVVGTIAALTGNKSVHDLVAAAVGVADQVDDLHVVIVGDGPARADLENQVARLGMAARVTFTGFRTDVIDVLSTFDCFVLASRLEGLGTSIMDAQVLGIPVVATRTGGIPDLVEDGVSGLLVPPGDPHLLGSAIGRMLREPDLRQRCAENAARRAQRYDYRNMVRGTLEAYRSVLGPAAS